MAVKAWACVLSSVQTNQGLNSMCPVWSVEAQDQLSLVHSQLGPILLPAELPAALAGSPLWPAGDLRDTCCGPPLPAPVTSALLPLLCLPNRIASQHKPTTVLQDHFMDLLVKQLQLKHLLGQQLFNLRPAQGRDKSPPAASFWSARIMPLSPTNVSPAQPNCFLILWTC